ncbi:arylsulfatase [Rhizobium leguminosarum bv. viciae 248]|uniref:arylsulfatase n=1 Tax=Rhizobium leguminosarum TaxID=384 RepID=UPI00036801BD|nr:arylsulfatase [Rhizobium leguminosarum]MCA2409691.1 arylsulfatase [Rhizobium leguminosarum]NKM62380.1 sulfatase-like hydrolase/transferase [Rhizobium leguminosarum bv. viciae]QHW26795.1 arylsulfatase [Rhizobium leguminosarum bv. viciae 248]
MNSIPSIRALILSASVLVLTAGSSLAQQTTGTPGSPSATTTIDGKYLPNPPSPFGGTINLDAKDSKPYWPPTVVPPKGAPNVLLIMTDDQGYGVSGTFGGVIPTPTMDRIANAGLSFTQFHSTALCSPSRAALITGRNHHSVGFGVITEMSTGYAGYDSVIGPESATIGTILRENGYATAWIGKNHNTPSYQISSAGPFDQWPTGMGFDHFYGFMGGETDQWTPFLFRDRTQVFPWVGNPGYNLTTDMADDAINYIKGLNNAAPDKPFFVYYVPGGSHAPHQPTPEWIKKISDMHLFDQGWEKLRETIFANQKRLGVIPANTQLTPWPDGQSEYGGARLQKWETLSPDEKKLFIRQADVFAAYTAYTDHEIGRVVQAVEDEGKLDNTLIIYISGDNGNSAEGSTLGTPNEMAAIQGVNIPVAEQLKFFDDWGSGQTTPHMAVGWTWAFDTPFKWTKQVASHFGGTRQGMAISWPGHIKDTGGIRTQFHHMIDIVPTILEATGIQAPVMVDGVAQRPIEGVSMAYIFDNANANAPSTRTTQYFEMVGNRAIYHDGWIATTTPPLPPWDLGLGKFPDVVNGYTWELYNLAEDYSENNDLAAQMPDKLRDMKELFLVEAAKYNVFPLDNSFTARAATPRPSATAGRTVFTYTGDSSGLPYSDAPDITGKSYSITAEVDIPSGDAEGMINTLGGRGGGHGLYLLNGKPVFVYNFFDLERFRWESPAALTPGKHTIAFHFKYDGPGFGKGGSGVLSVDGREVASKTIPHTIPFVETIYETFDVGVDTRTGVDDNDYQPPYRFTGKLDKLTVKLVPLNTAEERLLQQKKQDTKSKAQ